MKQVGIFIFLSMLLSGCACQNSDFFAYHDDGTRKPVVAALPIRDSSETSLCWDVSEELLKGLHLNARDRGELYMVDASHVEAVVQELGDTDLHKQDLAYYKRFVGCDFVVLMDFLEHNEIPYRRGEIEPLYIIDTDDAFVLAMKMRVTLIDLRGSEPRVILKEITKSNHMIQRDRHDVDYITNKWGSKDYSKTPIGMAHERLTRDLARRLETVVKNAAIR